MNELISSIRSSSYYLYDLGEFTSLRGELLNLSEALYTSSTGVIMTIVLEFFRETESTGCIHTEREKFFSVYIQKERNILRNQYTQLGRLGKSKISRVGWKAGGSKKSCSSSPKTVCKQMCPFPWRGLSFSIKAFN